MKNTPQILNKAIGFQGSPEKITIDISGVNKAAVEGHNEDNQSDIQLRRIKNLNLSLEQDHRAIKRLTQPMLGFKASRSARNILRGIELMSMIKNGQMIVASESISTPAVHYSLAA